MEKEQIRFEEAILKLEGIVQKLETGDVPLEDAISLYKEGMELSVFCHGKLQDAEKQLISIKHDYFFYIVYEIICRPEQCLEYRNKIEMTE